MEEQLISFETAKLAKEKGFRLGIGWFGFDNQFYVSEGVQTGMLCENHRGNNPVACTQSLLQKWLRDVHKIYVASYHDLNPKHDGIIYYTNWGFINDPNSKNYKYSPLGGYDESANWETYEEALEFGLQEALRLIDKQHENNIQRKNTNK